jgi:phage tail-like protein
MAIRKSTAAVKSASATRAGSVRTLFAESPRSGRVATILPAVAAEIVTTEPDAHLAPPAMAIPGLKGAQHLAAQASAAVGDAMDKALSFGAEASASVTIAAAAKAKLSAMGSSTKDKHTGAATKRQGDPDIAYAFDIQIGGVSYGMFTEVSGLSWKAEVQPMPEGGNNAFVRGLIRPGKFELLTLKRGWFAATGEFIDLLRGVLDPVGKLVRKNVTITVLSRNYEEIGRYDLSHAAVVEYEGPALNSMSGQVGFEQIRMVYDSFTYTPKG